MKITFEIPEYLHPIFAKFDTHELQLALLHYIELGVIKSLETNNQTLLSLSNELAQIKEAIKHLSKDSVTTVVPPVYIPVPPTSDTTGILIKSVEDNSTDLEVDEAKLLADLESALGL